MRENEESKKERKGDHQKEENEEEEGFLPVQVCPLPLKPDLQEQL